MISIRRSKVQLRVHFHDALLQTCSKYQENNIELVFCQGLIEVPEDHQRGKLVSNCGNLLLELYYDAVTVCTKGPPMPEIGEFSLASKLALTLDDFGLASDGLAADLVAGSLLNRAINVTNSRE
jgi:hypothetical protein